MRVLLIEDDTAVARSTELVLETEGMKTYTADLGMEGIVLAKLHDYDIILLDLGLPDMSGYEVLRALRAAKVRTPVMVMSGSAGAEETARSLGLGADDYVAKPCYADELIARILAIVRRSNGHGQSVVVIDDLAVDICGKEARVAGARVRLTGKEYQVLELLALRANTVISKGIILDHLYNGIHEPEPKVVETFIHRLRKKLSDASGGKDYIETAQGFGYMLCSPEGSPPAAPQPFPEENAGDARLRRLWEETEREAAELRSQVASLTRQLEIAGRPAACPPGAAPREPVRSSRRARAPVPKGWKLEDGYYTW